MGDGVVPVAHAAELPGKIETVEEVKAEIIRVFGTRAANALCIAKNESGFGWGRVNTTGNKPADSRDRGVYQLNSYWHAEVTDAQAFDARENIAQAYRISKGGTNWGSWSTHYLCDV